MVNFNYTGKNLANLYPSIFDENDAEVKNFSSNEVKNHGLADKMAGPQRLGKSPLGIGGFLKNDGIKGSEAFWEKLFGNNLNNKVEEFCNSRKILTQPLTFNYYTNEFDDFVSSVFLAFSWNNDDNTLLIKRLYFEPENQEQKADYFRVKCGNSQKKDVDKIKKAIKFFTKKTIDDENENKHRC